MTTSSKDSDEGRKLALIIANGDYHRAENRINNYQTNIEQLSKLLESVDFQVNTILNRNKHEINTDVIDFSKRIHDGDLIFCYLLGHAKQVDERNYFLPIDDRNIQSERDIEGLLARLVKQNRSHVTLLLLDCCRPYFLDRTSKPIGK